MWFKSDKQLGRQATLQLEENISKTSLINDDVDKPSLGPAPDAKLGLGAALRRYPRIAIYSCLLTSTILLWGYDSSIVGGVSSMPEFQKVFGVPEGDRWIIPASWLSIWNVGSPLGGMAGSMIAGWLGDKVGRRWMLATSTMVSIGSVALCLISDTPSTIVARRALFLVAKCVSGLSIGAVTTMTQTYMSEVLPQQLRASIIPFFPVFQLVGQIVGAIIVQIQMDVNGPSSYRITFATQFAFSVMPLVVSFIMPESPVWLLRKNKVERARRNNQRLEYNKRFLNAHILSFDKLQKTVAEERRKSGEDVKYTDCFKGIDFRRTGLVMLMNFVPDFFGLSLLGNANYVLQQIGQDAKTANLFFIVGIALGLAGNMGTFYTLSRVGRRITVLVTLSIICPLWLSIGIAGTVQKTGTITIWFTSVVMMLIIFTAAIGVWPASFVIAAETSSLRLRARTQGIGWTTNGFSGVAFGITMPYVYNPDAANLGGMTAYIFFGFTLLALVLSYFLLPEMKDRSIAEIDKMFELELPARQFKSWHGNVDIDEDLSRERSRSSVGSVDTLQPGYPAMRKPSIGSEDTLHPGFPNMSRSSIGSEDTYYVGGYGRIVDREEV